MNVAQVHDLAFVLSVLSRLERAGIRPWLFGGWAEELRGLRPAGAHGDIDLLYPASSFNAVDDFLALDPAVTEIVPKRFSHKRAFEIEKVVVELILVERENGGDFTRFFSGLYRFQWPEDTFAWLASGNHPRLPVVGECALRRYRQDHVAIERAYQIFVG